MTLAKPHKRWVATVLALVLLAVLGAAALGKGSAQRWQITDLGPTLPLSYAAILNTGAEAALVWQPMNASPPFVYTPLNAQRSASLQPYAEGTPSDWRIVSTARGTLHMVWRERDGRLRSALLTPQGETLRGPVELADTAERDFALVTLADGSARVLWRTASERIASVVLDAEGRPGPVQRHAPRHVQHLAAANNDAGVYLAWAERSAPATLTLRYALLVPGTEGATALAEGATLGTWRLGSDESVRTFALGADATHGYLLLGIMDAHTPHHERVTVLSFPLHAPEHVRRIPLRLAAHPTAPRPLTLGASTVPEAEMRFPTNDAESAPLRWPRPGVGGKDFFAVAVAVWREERWQASIVYFRAGEPLGYEVLNAPPADAAPPTLALRPDGAPILSWGGLVHGETRRYRVLAVP